MSSKKDRPFFWEKDFDGKKRGESWFFSTKIKKFDKIEFDYTLLFH